MKTNVIFNYCLFAANCCDLPNILRIAQKYSNLEYTQSVWLFSTSIEIYCMDVCGGRRSSATAWLNETKHFRI